jgi:thiol:disulfide interchange protein
VEEHAGKVIWSAPIQLSESANPESLNIMIKFSGQVCADEGACIPISGREVTADYAGALEPSAGGSGFRGERSHVTIRGTADPATVPPGDVVQLSLTIAPDTDWHVYAYAPRDSGSGSKPTLLAIDLPPGWKALPPHASSEPQEDKPEFLDEAVFYHEGEVTWTVEVEIPEDAKPGQYELTGGIAYQVCTKTRCDMPMAAEFRGIVQVGQQREGGATSLAFASSSYSEVAKSIEPAPDADLATAPPAGEETEAGGGLDLSRLETTDATSDTPMAVVLMTAFAAGFILNFMPCVLPVIGLKIMAFVQQAGDRRDRVFMLNVSFCLGLLSVFMVLATLAVFLGLSWGQQFSSATFNIILASVVFVFALSFLGVWEIPIPGFVGGSAAHGLAEQEGYVGAFSKGILTTVLATPCSGPMLTPALTWAVSQPPIITYTGFACVGLGMASPYLLIGAFPQLISFLPKPGAWMDTFKHIMGFVLLGTVVFLLTFMPVPYVVPTFAFLVGLWAAFWWIGRTPLTESFQTKLRAWLGGAAFAGLIGLISYAWLLGIMESRFQRAVERQLGLRNAPQAAVAAAPDEKSHELPWQPFSLDALGQLTRQRKTVFIDFTADW